MVAVPPTVWAAMDPQLWLLWLVSLGALIPVAGLFSILPLLMAEAGLPASAYGWTQVASACTVLVLSVPLNRWLTRRASRGTSMVPLMAVKLIGAGSWSRLPGLAHSSRIRRRRVHRDSRRDHSLRRRRRDPRPDHAAACPRPLRGDLGSTLAAAVICAPALAGWSLAQGGPQLVALTTALCGLLGAAACLPLSVLMHHPRPQQTLPTT